MFTIQKIGRYFIGVGMYVILTYGVSSDNSKWTFQLQVMFMIY